MSDLTPVSPLPTPEESTDSNSQPSSNSDSKKPLKSLRSKAFKEWWKSFLKELKEYFNISDDMETQPEIEESIRSGVSFKGSQLLVLIFAIFIASLGLNTDSIPVIIGAMLISPLMGPIIGMGLAIGIQDFDLLRRGLKNIGMAILGSLLASAIYFLISPQYEGASQLLARTSPSIYDVFIALFGGAAGIVSIACRNKGQVMPGVAIATSLMPPLCTAGYGLATLQPHFLFGAFYLFFTNMIFILFATYIGVKLMKFKPKVYENAVRARKVQRIVYSVVIGTIALSAYLTVVMIGNSIFVERASQFVEREMVFPNTQVLSHKEYVMDGKRYIDVNLIGAALPKDSLQLAMMNKLDSVGLGGTLLNIKQGFAFATPSAKDRAEADDDLYRLMQQELAQRQEFGDSLQRVLMQRDAFSRLSAQLAPEVKVLFPNISDFAVGRIETIALADTSASTLNMVFVKAPRGLSVDERRKLVEYLAVRLGEKNLHLALNPASFPWPASN